MVAHVYALGLFGHNNIHRARRPGSQWQSKLPHMLIAATATWSLSTCTASAQSQAPQRQARVFVMAHGGKAQADEFKKAAEWLQSAGHHMELHETKSPEDLSTGVKEYIKEKGGTGAAAEHDVLVAAGGDGSINQVVNELCKQDAPRDSCIAVLPLGTANDLATSLGIPSDDLVKAMQIAVAGKSNRKKIDVGFVNKKAFLNMCSGGFGTEATKKTDQGLKAVLGKASYFITGLFHAHELSSKEVTAKAPHLRQESAAEWQVASSNGKGSSDETWEGKLLILGVGNAQQAGGGQNLCPDAKLDDGLLDVTFVQNVPPKRVPELMQVVLAGKRQDDLQECVKTFKTPWFEVSSKENLQVNRDGEPMNEEHYKFEIEKHRLHIMVPDEARPLFKYWSTPDSKSN